MSGTARGIADRAKLEGVITEVTTRVLWQEPGAIVRRKWRGPVRLTVDELIAQKEGEEPVLRIPIREIASVRSVDALKMGKSYYRPFRKRVLRIDVKRPDGALVVGVVLRDPEAWRIAIDARIATGR